ncbi:hypothetical protein [Flaviflexus massiliensis]|uniref:hypothetical protein n=1 Tax=Flaviflexus massiliensis TaxID=1522309 RepID=UPI0006D5A9BE|nr:hypothetical protein [Flaviflexus massiliensis]
MSQIIETPAVTNEKSINAGAILSVLAVLFVAAVAGLALSLPYISVVATIIGVGTIITATIVDARYEK